MVCTCAGEAAPAFGVRGACSRFSVPSANSRQTKSAGKPGALQTLRAYLSRRSKVVVHFHLIGLEIVNGLHLRGRSRASVWSARSLLPLFRSVGDGPRPKAPARSL